MILVVVGNATQGFSRLLKAVDELAGDGFFKGEQVFMQSGHTAEFRADHCRQRDFLSLEDFVAMTSKARLIICHAGAGTLLHAVKEGRVPVVMPRRKRYREHIDDHQVQLVNALTVEGKIVPAFEPIDLPLAIDDASRRRCEPASGPPPRMLSLVSEAIEQFLEDR